MLTRTAWKRMQTRKLKDALAFLDMLSEVDSTLPKAELMTKIKQSMARRGMKIHARGVISYDNTNNGYDGS